ncbi:MAG: hypothetical protein IPI35_15490 [Deltaproteobacteria bacterium]|nr:hypothetical protein [Deltaproteobacteria bacterium]
MRFTWMILPLLSACAPSPQTRPGPDPDGFAQSIDVRITNPEDGAVVTSPFAMTVEAGDDVASLQLLLDGEASGRRLSPDDRRVLVSADPGRRRVTLQALDKNGDVLSEDTLRVTVLADASDEYVAFATPYDDAAVVSPVQLIPTASDGVAQIELRAGGEPVAVVSPGEVYTLRTGHLGALTLSARGLDADGALLTETSVDVTLRAPNPVAESGFNQRILDLIDTYPDDGTYTYYWPSGTTWSGSTRDIYYQGALVADDGGFSSCYCSGITWELYLETWRGVAAEMGLSFDDLNGLSDTDLKTMRTDWYVRELDGPGPDVALSARGLGARVESLDDLRPGDLVQFWRTSGSGHTVVFMGFEEDDAGNLTGLSYVSCQGASFGFGENTEYFGAFSGAIDPLLLFAGRPTMPSSWR